MRSSARGARTSRRLSADRMIALYRKRAGRYDYTANLYYLIGFREWKYQKMAVAALDMHMRRPPGLRAVVAARSGGPAFHQASNRK